MRAKLQFLDMYVPVGYGRSSDLNKPIRMGSLFKWACLIVHFSRLINKQYQIMSYGQGTEVLLSENLPVHLFEAVHAAQCNPNFTEM
jgi:hypothetical protein